MKIRPMSANQSKSANLVYLTQFPRNVSSQRTPNQTKRRNLKTKLICKFQLLDAPEFSFFYPTSIWSLTENRKQHNLLKTNYKRSIMTGFAFHHNHYWEVRPNQLFCHTYKEKFLSHSGREPLSLFIVQTKWISFAQGALIGCRLVRRYIEKLLL